VCFKSFKILLEKGVKNGQHLSTIFDNFWNFDRKAHISNM
jgi:hypothetical protein